MTQSKPSKSARKRQQQALQGLGEQLVGLDDGQLAGLELGDRLLDAISEARRMKSHEALRRQKQYIGKLMREVDPAPIHALLERIDADARRVKRIFASAERWRDRLVNDGQEAMGAFENETSALHPELAALLDELKRTHNDRLEREMRRRIFRAVHAALVAGSQDG